MNSTFKTFQMFMQDALAKSLPGVELESAISVPEAKGMLRTSLGFEGSGMKARAYISCSKDFLQKTCPLPGGPRGYEENELLDWLGELGNLIMGRLKNKLLAHGITIRIAPPMAATDWSEVQGPQTIASWFQSGHSLLGFECEIDGIMPEIGPPLPQRAEILPGDAIYRLSDSVDAAPLVDLISKIRSGGEGSDEIPSDSLNEEDFEAHEATGTHKMIASPYRSEALAPPAPKPPLRIHYHGKSLQPQLASLSWPAIDRFTLRFNTGLECSLAPESLLKQGLGALEVEGITLTFTRDGDAIQLTIESLGIHLSKKPEAA